MFLGIAIFLYYFNLGYSSKMFHVYASELQSSKRIEPESTVWKMTLNTTHGFESSALVDACTDAIVYYQPTDIEQAFLSSLSFSKISTCESFNEQQSTTLHIENFKEQWYSEIWFYYFFKRQEFLAA